MIIVMPLASFIEPRLEGVAASGGGAWPTASPWLGEVEIVKVRRTAEVAETPSGPVPVYSVTLANSQTRLCPGDTEIELVPDPIRSAIKGNL